MYVFSGRRHQYTNINAVFILTVTIALDVYDI